MANSSLASSPVFLQPPATCKAVPYSVFHLPLHPCTCLLMPRLGWLRFQPAFTLGSVSVPKNWSSALWVWVNILTMTTKALWINPYLQGMQWGPSLLSLPCSVSHRNEADPQKPNIPITIPINIPINNDREGKRLTHTKWSSSCTWNAPAAQEKGHLRHCMAVPKCPRGWLLWAYRVFPSFLGWCSAHSFIPRQIKDLVLDGDALKALFPTRSCPTGTCMDLAS